MRAVIAITGASGIVYGLRLAEELGKAGARLDFVVSGGAKKVMDCEVRGGSKKALARLAKLGRVYSETDFSAPFASGSRAPDAFAVCPCSMKTLSDIANGYSDNLVKRGAEVALKEGRLLVLVPREMPFTAIQLENMLKLARLGAAIMPPQPAFYGGEGSAGELVDFVVGKIMDRMGVKNALYRRWGA
ncbi:MAG: UbiX family flavin prenyltransferase [Candidatus ainarchaeum sp.]|nr:UbiX family flavin prenyltransferase [Candidatus ainarchaeum sp.]